MTSPEPDIPRIDTSLLPPKSLETTRAHFAEHLKRQRRIRIFGTSLVLIPVVLLVAVKTLLWFRWFRVHDLSIWGVLGGLFAVVVLVMLFRRRSDNNRLPSESALEKTVSVTEGEVFQAFRHFATAVAPDGAPILNGAHSLALIHACHTNNLAVLGIDGFGVDQNDKRMQRRTDLCLDCSDIQATSWEDYQQKSISAALHFLRSFADDPDLAFEFVLWTHLEREQSNSPDVEIAASFPDGTRVRASNKMVKYMRRWGWRAEEINDLVQNPGRVAPAVDYTIRPE